MAANSRAEVEMIVLNRLAQLTQYSNPKPTSEIKDWFKKVEKHDTDTGAPVHRTDLFVYYTLQDVGGTATLGAAQLIGGKFKTVKQLVDHLEATR